MVNFIKPMKKKIDAILHIQTMINFIKPMKKKINT